LTLDLKDMPRAPDHDRLGGEAGDTHGQVFVEMLPYRQRASYAVLNESEADR